MGTKGCVGVDTECGGRVGVWGGASSEEWIPFAGWPRRITYGRHRLLPDGRHDEVVAFSRGLGADVWLEQPDCTILEAGDFRVGFCDRESADLGGILTFVFEDRDGVDAIYDRLADLADDEPRVDETDDSYQFFATDPEGRTVEFQCFE